jgi:phosphate transport system substrate-binding protein
MWQKEKKYNSVIGLGMLLALASTPIVATIFISQFAVAQTSANEPSFPLLKTIPSGTTVKVDGSTSMAKINESLKQSYEQQYAGTKVELAANGADTALTSLLDGKVDLAGIGRGLTPAEQAKGLEQKRVDRQKIAIVVAENNPFKGNLTNQQFAKIFRGEITDWSQVGGKKGKIRFIDRPTSSDTREAFRNYPAFKAANFATSSTAIKLTQDDSAELVKQLGKDGIGYVIANQVSKVPSLRVLKLHQTLPDDARYPFSQPFVYAYKKNPNPGVTGFLGFASGEPGTKAIKTVRSAEANAIAQGVTGTTTTQANATASPGTDATLTQANATSTATAEATTSATGSENTTNTSAINGTSENTNTGDNKQAFIESGKNVASSETGNTVFPWWLLLPIAALGAAGLWFLAGGKRRKDKELINPETSTNSPEINPLPTQSNFFAANATNLVDSATNTATNISDRAVTDISNAGNAALAGGVALAGGAAAGIGLWSRLGYGDEEDASHEESNEENISAETEITHLQEPAIAIMPPLAEVPNVEVEEPVIDVNLPNVELPNAELPNTELPNVELPNVELPNAELPNIDTTLEVDSPNWLDNLNAAGGATLAAGAALAGGAGLSSKFANRDTNDETNDISLPNIEQPDLTASINTPEVPEVPEIPTIEVSEPSLDLPEISSAQLPDVSTQTPEIEAPEIEAPEIKAPEIETPTGSNLLDNITPTGGAALAGGVVAAGAGLLWSGFTNRKPNADIPEPDLNLSVDTPEIPDVESWEVTAPSIQTPEIPDVESWELTAPSIQTPEIPDVESWELTTPSIQTPEIPDVESWELTTPSIQTPEIPDVESWEVTAPPIQTPEILDVPSQQINHLIAPLPDVWDETPEETPQSDRNLLDYITISGGAAAAAVGLANQNRDNRENTEPVEENIAASLETPEVVLPEAVINPELSIQEIPEAVELAPKADTTDNSVNLDNPTETGVSLADEIGSPNWGTPEEATSEEETPTNTTEAETSPTAFDTVANASESTEDVIETSLSESSAFSFREDLKTTGLEINPGIAAGGAAIAGAGAAIWAATSNSGDRNEQNVVPTIPPTVEPIIEPTINIPSEIPPEQISEPISHSTITLTPRTPKWAYASWNIVDAEKEVKQKQGGTNFVLRLYDTTNIDLSYQTAQLVQQYECEETIENRFVAIPISDRDYMVEIGYLTQDNSWLPIARSRINRVFSRPHQEFWFEADAELIIHGATEPGSTVSIGGQTLKIKEDGTFHLRIPFTDDLIDYVMTAVSNNGDNAKTIHMHFSHDGVKKEEENDK